jgi:hypothetical protein
MPFVFTVDLESGGINDHEATRFERLAQDVPGIEMLRLEMLL